ncbi:MAG: hypothetical protein AUJ55_02540 [Proteobacteria bacterium CG1_02_64_396]|nr:MAG: hypothetical protein AUJ55_02540 [Proteobacteria bacterium CG1_02_64_396]
MEREIVANAMHHATWGIPIAIYFYLVGASAGSFVVSSLGWVFGIPKYKPISLFSAITAIVLLLIVPVLLVFDLGHLWRFFHLLFLTSFSHWSAPMMWGTCLIMAYTFGMMVYAWFVWRHDVVWAKRFGILAVVLAIGTHWYTGVVTQLIPGLDPNHTATAPILFLTGAFVSGIGFLCLMLALRNRWVGEENQVAPELIVGLSRLMMWGIVFDLFLLLNEFLQMTYGRGEEWVVFYKVLLGPFQVPFVWIEIVWGLLLPLTLLAWPKVGRQYPVVLTACFMATTGIIGMRIWWVMGGFYVQTFY